MHVALRYAEYQILSVKNDLWYLAIFHGRAIVVASSVGEGEADTVTGGALHHNLPKSFGAVVRVWTFECGVGCVVGVRQHFNWVRKHHAECVASAVGRVS